VAAEREASGSSKKSAAPVDEATTQIKTEEPTVKKKISLNQLRNIGPMYYDVLTYVYELYKDEPNILMIPPRQKVV
jgi:hypothetical protein